MGVGALIGFVMLLKAHTAMAEQMVTCRKAKCEKINKDEIVCVYKGANNTIESQFFKRGGYIPSEYQCKYDPNAKKEMTIKETLKAIKEGLDD